MILRVSATDVDALRFFKAPPVPEMQIELDDLLRRLRRQEPATEAMLAGTAFHQALESAPPGEYADLAAGGYTFDLAGIVGELEVPPIRELKTTREYEIDGITVTLVGKVDALHGRRVDDHKLTGSLDVEKYLSSFQWKAYLELFGADEFRWNVFEGKETRPHSKHYVITALHPLSAYRYPSMRADVENEIGLFVEFAREWLPERIVREAA